MKSIHLINHKQQPTQSSPVEATITDQFDTMNLHSGFYYKDHLGNNRAVVDEQGKTLQSTDYYPYGMPYLKEFGNQLKEFVLRGNIKFVA